MARARSWAAIYVQDFDAPCVLQFAWISALCCALHRSTSLVIHRSGSYLLRQMFKTSLFCVSLSSTRVSLSRRDERESRRRFGRRSFSNKLAYEGCFVFVRRVRARALTHKHTQHSRTRERSSARRTGGAACFTSPFRSRHFVLSRFVYRAYML